MNEIKPMLANIEEKISFYQSYIENFINPTIKGLQNSYTQLI